MTPKLLTGPFFGEWLWLVDFEMSPINSKEKHQADVHSFPVADHLTDTNRDMSQVMQP
jgi:hypothetical protein